MSACSRSYKPRNRDLTESLEQQTATSEILRAIASSPTDVQPVLNIVAERAARLCDASDSQILRVDGDVLLYNCFTWIHYRGLRAYEQKGVPVRRDIVAGRAVR